MKISIIHIIIIIITISLSGQIAHAQAPGLLGKRTIVYYDYTISPSYLGYSTPYNYSTKGKRGIGGYIRGTHKASLEYTLSRKHSLNLHYSLHRGGYGADNSFENNLNPALSHNYRSSSIGLSLKRYRVKLQGRTRDNGAIAPIGRYLEPKIFAIFLTEEDRLTADNSIAYSDKKIYYGGSVTWGRRFLIGKVILNFGLEISYIHPQDDEVSFWDVSSPETTIAVYTPDVPTTSYAEMVLHHSVNFHIGIGYPLF